MISLALRVLVLWLLVAIGHCQQTLEPFTSVVVCANSDVGFQPSTDSSYSMVVQGNQELFDTVEAVVEDGVLYVQSPKAAQSDNGDVVAIISAPKDAINDLTVSGNGDVYLVDGFTSPTFQIINAGNGDVEADLAVSDAITVRVEDNGDVELVGSFGSLDLTLSGNGDFDIFGLTGNANVKLEGNGDVFIGGSDQTVISGSQTGNGELEYSGGTCTVQSEFAEDTCQREDDEEPDSIMLPRPSSSESVRNSIAICAKGGAAPSSPATSTPSSTSTGDITGDGTGDDTSSSSSGYRTLTFVAVITMMMAHLLI